MTDESGASDSGAGGVLAELQESGSITIGIANEIPYGYEDDEGNVTGEAPEVAKAVLAELGIEEVDAVAVDFGALIPGLESGQYDMIAAGMFITPDRAEQIIFSDPDYCVSEAFAVAEGNPLGISDYQSIIDAEATLAISPGTVEVDHAEFAGVPEDLLEPFDDINAQYDALEAGRVDVVVGTRLTVEGAVAGMEGFEATEPFIPLDADGNEIPGCGAFGFADQEFRDAFNEVLKELQADGTVAEIIAEFGFTEQEAEAAANQTVESLLGEEPAPSADGSDAAEGSDAEMAEDTADDDASDDTDDAAGTEAEETEAEDG